PGHDPAIAAITGNPLHSVYRAIDEAIGSLVQRAGDANIIVFSGHGMATRYGAPFLLRDLLYALGVATSPRVPLGSKVREAVARVWRALPNSARTMLSPLRDRVTGSDDAHEGIPEIGVDFERSQCFPLANGLAVAGIRLNLAGREPRGILAPGDDADRFCAQLEADLLAIVDEITGEALVHRVIRTRDLCAGERLDALPDLLVEWNDAVAHGSTALGNGAASRVRARSPKIGTVEGVNEYGRSGEHRAGGWFVAAGPGVSAGRLGREVSLLDLAPTFARILGVELPGIDGKPIEELVRLPVTTR
ncbi:MAG TPA: hypothetical protein VK511_13675, partial [Gemmatimonadaceae bacterium]|nr:hypothetical protein [Gemmatimonadaceae bacterium]